MSRRFAEGMGGDIGGVLWRVVRGKKSLNDLRLDICVPRFVPVKMDLGFLFADFYADNEHALALDGYFSENVASDAGAKYRAHIQCAQVVGWTFAADNLHAERDARRRRNAA